jgi:toxin ParE1/3/4
MSYAFHVMPEAAFELREARAWYNEKRRGLGDELFAAVDQVFERIRQHPEQHRVIYAGDVRKVLVPLFPYMVVYQIRGATIVVISVHHTSRDPHRWQDRVE